MDASTATVDPMTSRSPRSGKSRTNRESSPPSPTGSHFHPTADDFPLSGMLEDEIFVDLLTGGQNRSDVVDVPRPTGNEFVDDDIFDGEHPVDGTPHGGSLVFGLRKEHVDDG
jgi:hypothetical protein